MGKVLKTHARCWNDIAVYGDYMPWNVHKAAGGDRSNFPEHSGRILDLKEKSLRAVAHFCGIIEPELKDQIAIAVVPSHDPAKRQTGLKMLATALAARGNRVDAGDCLVRTEKIEKLAHGGARDKNIHLASVSVGRPELIKGRDVLLLDDVTKTGNSLAACRELLLKAGAASVQCATIGKT